MNIFPADYDTLAERDERLAVMFGRRYGHTKPLGSLIDRMTFTNADRDGIGLARAVIRQADRFPAAFGRILDAYYRRMEGALPRAALISEAREAGWGNNPVAFLYGVSASLYETCNIDGPHALLIATLVGDIERYVTDSIAEADGMPPRLSFIAPRIHPDTPESDAREMFCTHFVGHGEAYSLLQKGVSAPDLISGQAHRAALIVAVSQGCDAVYADAALRRGISDFEVIRQGYEHGISLDYLAEAVS